jgi:hypothetical protein
MMVIVKILKVKYSQTGTEPENIIKDGYLICKTTYSWALVKPMLFFAGVFIIFSAILDLKPVIYIDNLVSLALSSQYWCES